MCFDIRLPRALVGAPDKEDPITPPQCLGLQEQAPKMQHPHGRKPRVTPQLLDSQHVRFRRHPGILPALLQTALKQSPEVKGVKKIPENRCM